MWAIFLPNANEYCRAITELMDEAAKPSGSERIVTVVGGSLLEHAVESTLKHRLIDDKIVARLFQPGKPLGDPTPQIDLLFALNAFDDKTRQALKGLAGVRNFFAHNLSASFDDDNKGLNNSIKRLTMHQDRTFYPHNLWGPDTKIPIETIRTRKDRFVVNLKLALIFLMRDRVSHEPHSNRVRSEDEKLILWPDRYSSKHGGDSVIIPIVTSAGPSSSET